MKDLNGKTALITGAGSGFGLELARLCATEGMRLVLVDVQADALDRVAQELAAHTVLAQRVDVSSPAEMQTLAAAVQAHVGAPHLVFNNAGVGFGGLIWEATVRDWDWVLGVNLMGVVHGVRLFTPMMLEAAQRDPAWQGHIVNTASMAGVLNAPNMGVYNVSKHAVVSLSETLHHDLSLVTDQVHCSVLCPYFVPTGIADSHRNRDPATMARPTPSQRISQAMSSKAVATGKLSAADVARLVLDGVRAQAFWLFSHPQALGAVSQRADEMVQGRNPGDPFAERPELGQQLRAALRG
ncbi:NAD(P)-dependent dehydrogenase (short-subunit alcohol dehydrogenase family) [Inhella inkyongensis]|uniref:NAD(P)-dependent dehydrogenase (Short-subunit alcohol dehydrogenase family) n=1 Tax=Inhella inkyongensis TaxID=392593 RepID=A0A840RYA2_9BURK|nr:SDR family oxidoreductase [Inhella inkyongensis]MBB5203697.1 NAD(P)-dependent dehydrogenase (short-subunit alcohol dehydrogenase family) [Inhella inkyongensis]